MDIVKFCMDNDLTIEIKESNTWVEHNPSFVGRIPTLHYFNSQGQKRPVMVCTSNEGIALKCLARLINKNIKTLERELRLSNNLSADVTYSSDEKIEFTKKSIALYELMGL